jgi:peroxiredoxin
MTDRPSLFYFYKFVEGNYRDMKRILGILALMMCLTGCIKEDVGADLKVGDALPDFSVRMNNGEVVSDESLIGNVSCIVFFHTTCPDCQQTLPVVQEIYDEYLSKGISFALISRAESAEEIDVFWREKGFNMPYSAQTDRDVYSRFAGSRIPRVYICDKDGIIRYIFTDDPIPTYDDLMSSLESLIR